MSGGVITRDEHHLMTFFDKDIAKAPADETCATTLEENKQKGQPSAGSLNMVKFYI